MTENNSAEAFPSILPGYTIRESAKVKRMRLKVSLLGEVEVVIPKGFDRNRIAPFVARNEEWLRKTIVRIEAQQASTGEAADTLPDNIVLCAIGEEWRVDYRQTEGRYVAVAEMAHGCLIAHGAIQDKDACKAALRTWVANKARTHLAPSLWQLSAETELPFHAVAVRGQRTRWGSCSSLKVININWKLLFLPPELVRYLFIHELCHTVHLNHSRRYWQLVEKKEPAYKELDAQLRTASRYVPLWVQHP